MKRGKANVKALVAGILLVPATTVFLLSVLGTVYTLFDWTISWMSLLICFLVNIVMGCFTWLCWRTVLQARIDLVALPYVPPVTAGTLPAADVLVRAAEEPMSPAESLLRAAASEQTTAQELLRATQEGKVVRQ